MLNPWVLLGVFAAWVASMVGVGYWQRDDGALACKAEYQTRDNLALVKANNDNRALNKAIRQQETNHQNTLESLGLVYSKEFNDAEARRKRDVAAAYAAGGRLRDRTGSCGEGGGGTQTEAVAPSRGSDGAQGCELSGATSAALLNLVHDADRDVRQLAKCQAVVVEYLKQCNSTEQ